jgi:hypothetical protein
VNYTMTKPCPECPFRRDGAGANPVRLMLGRVDEIAGVMLNPQGGEFPCHKTTVEDEDDDDESGRCTTPDSQHCAGALIFAEKNDNHTGMMKIAGRLGMYDPRKLDRAAFPEVFDDIEEMRATALDRRRRRQ